jgi:signal transduction histidine kinase
MLYLPIEAGFPTSGYDRTFSGRLPSLTAVEPLYSPQSRAERLIAAGRVILAVSSLFAVWLDPAEPAKYADIAYSLLAAYVVYAAVISLLVWRSDAPSHRLALITHAFDLIFFSLSIHFTWGSASPFTAYFVFALVCATLRWQWRGTLWTALVSLAMFLGVGLWVAEVVDDPGFKVYPVIVRSVYLVVMAVLLGYLGFHQEHTRREMALLADWPQDVPRQIEALVEGLLEHAAQALGAPRVLLAWVEREEPWLYLASWSAGSLAWSRAAPEAFGGLVAAPLRQDSFLCLDAAAPEPAVLRRGRTGLQRWRGSPLDAGLRDRFSLRAVLALPLQGEAVEGHLFFADKAAMTSDDLVLGEVVAGVVAARLDHFYLSQTLQEAVTTEERLRLARDLHDGVLQSLTGIGLRLAAVRGLLEEDPKKAREALDALQRLITLEQRDLRFFIQDLKPPPLAPAPEARSLAARVAELAQRMEIEWGLRAELHTEGLERIPEPLVRDVYLVVREALVNAVRHGEATAVQVEIAGGEDGQITIFVADNGKGFPVVGKFTHATLVAGGFAPRTLLERVTSLHGALTLESSPAGARLDIALPCEGRA